MDNYAVIGHPIKHSLSPLVHAEFAKQTQQRIHYIRIEAALDRFEEIVAEFRRQGGKGVNVTLPFKERAYQLGTQYSDAARRAKAANTLSFYDDHNIYADSTDGIGLVEDLTHNHHYSLQQKKILLLGAGGAARTIIDSLLELRPEQMVIANRTKEKAVQLALEFSGKMLITPHSFTELNQRSFDLIINATSLGLHDEPFNLPADLVNEQSWCYDLIYNLQQPTPFLQWAKKHGAAQCIDGLGMLVEQAAASFYLWRGVYPDTLPIIHNLRNTRMPIF